MSDIVLSKFPLSCYNCIWIHNCNYPPLYYYYHIAMYTVKILVTIRINTVLCSICYIDSNKILGKIIRIIGGLSDYIHIMYSFYQRSTSKWRRSLDMLALTNIKDPYWPSLGCLKRSSWLKTDEPSLDGRTFYGCSVLVGSRLLWALYGIDLVVIRSGFCGKFALNGC